MRHSNRVLLAGFPALACALGCEVIAGIDDRQPPSPAASSSAGSVGGGGGAGGSGTAGAGAGGSGTAGAGAGGSGTAGAGGGSMCGPTGTTVPVPDSATQFCSHTTMTGFCPDETMPYYGQDGNTLVNVPTYQLSQDPTEKTLTDCMTGLIWQVEPTTPSDLTWNAAIGQCDALAYAGFTDWRLPSRRELISLLDLGRPSLGNGTASVFPQELDSLVKPPPSNPAYWMHSEDVSAPATQAWAVRLIGSAITSLPKDGTGEGRALCVRGPERYTSPMFVIDTDIVTDTATGLVWERNLSGTAKWSTALDYCNALDLGGKQDWRLPTLKELAYLADDSLMLPAIDANAFPNTAAGEFWSSSPSSADTTLAWTVNFDYGGAQIRGTNFSYRMRCVRTDPLVP